MLPQPELSPAPVIREQTGQWVAPAARRCSMLSPKKFCFLNEEGELGASRDWQNERRSKLWLYNLHYFDDINAEDAAMRSAWHHQLVALWISENPPGFGVGWEPYPMSLRIVNWIKWALAGNKLDVTAKHSLAVQTRYLTKRLEWHLLGNHLFANAKALVFAGAFFDGEEARRWFNLGMKILKREVPEQILSDGGQFERSPMYHALAYEDVLDLFNLSGAYPKCFTSWQEEVASWKVLIEKMGDWLCVMCHPDGEIAFFNDTAIGVAPHPKRLLRYAQNLFPLERARLQGVIHLAESGYIRAEAESVVLLIDVAHIGPDYLPGHAHADTLSCELSIDGYRVLVNSGTSTYGNSAERLRQRATAAHNTVLINNKNSSEVWASFRVAKRACPMGLSVRSERGAVLVNCSHNGYARLAGRPVHFRKWSLGSTSLQIEDRIDGRFEVAKSRFHLHPDVIVESVESILLPSGRRVRLFMSGGQARVINTTWHPEFGVNINNKCIEVVFVDNKTTIEFCWS